MACISAGVAAAATLGSSLISSGGAKSAAKTQASAANNASALQEQMFQQTQQNIQPFINAGGAGVNALQSYLGVTPGGGFDPTAPGVAQFTADMFHQSPGYQWQLQQGLDAAQNAASVAGGVNSGNTLKALTQYGEGLANQDFYNALNSYRSGQQQTYGMLQGLSQLGAGAASGLGSLSGQLGSQLGSNITGAGNATAAGQVASTNALTGGLGGVVNSILPLLQGSGGGLQNNGNPLQLFNYAL